MAAPGNRQTDFHEGARVAGAFLRDLDFRDHSVLVDDGLSFRSQSQRGIFNFDLGDRIVALAAFLDHDCRDLSVILCCLCRCAAGNQGNERQRAGIDDDPSDLRQTHAKGVQAGALVRIVSHHSRECGVRNIDGRVEQHQKAIGYPGIDNFALYREIRRREVQDKDHAQRQTHPEQIGAELAPARAGAIGQGAHEKVSHAIGTSGAK